MSALEQHNDGGFEVAVSDLKKLAAAGYTLFPLRGSSKVPRDKGWRSKDYADFDAVAWLKAGGNVGIRLNDDDLVMDVDPRARGNVYYFQLVLDTDADLEEVPSTITGRGDGGRHYFFKKAPGMKTVGKMKDYPGIDAKTDGGYVVAPGSVHPDSGKRYASDRHGPDITEVTHAPAALLKLLQKPEPDERPDVGSQITGQQLKVLLSALDPEDYGAGGKHHDQWLNIAMACHDATGGEGEDIWLDWCAGDPQYGPDDWEQNQRRWGSFTAGKPGGATVKTLLKAVANAGRPDLVAGLPIEGAHDAFDDPVDVFAHGKSETNAGSTKTGIHFTPYARKDPKSLPSRDYLMKPTFIRQFTTGTLAHGAVGKSITLMTEAICLASGQALLGVRPHGRYRVVYWNGEDPREELDRRIEAICKHYDLPPEATDDHLFVDSGRDLPIDIVTLDAKTRLACPKDLDAIVSALKAACIDVLIVDPFVSTHSVPENDNGMIEAVAQAWNDVAERAGVAVHVSHHAVKARGRVVEAMDYRGGGAALAKLRYLRVFNRMSAKEAEQAGLPTEKANLHFRIDDREKSNLLPPSEDTNWYQLVTVDLENADFERDGLYAESDRIGVPTPWTFPDLSVSEPTLSDIKQLFALMGKKVWRKTSTAKEDWVGLVVAEALELDLEINDHRKAVHRYIKDWAEAGVLAVIKPSKPDKNGNRREGYVVGTMPSDG